MPRPRRALTPKERIDRSAYDLFTRHGIRAVGVDAIVARSRVGKMTLYRHYRSKDALSLAFFDRRWQEFSRGWQSALEALGLPPRRALLAVFDVLDKWYRSPDYAGCPVVKAVLESNGGDDPVYAGALRYFSAVRSFLRRLAVDAGVRNPDAIAMQWHILVWGSIIAARAQERDAARHAKALGAAILAREGRDLSNRSRSRYGKGEDKEGKRRQPQGRARQSGRRARAAQAGPRQGQEGVQAVREDGGLGARSPGARRPGDCRAQAARASRGGNLLPGSARGNRR